MKINVMAIHERWRDKLDDHQKVMLSFLTHLHRQYPNVKMFRLHTRDAKTILRIHHSSTMPQSFGPFKVAFLHKMMQLWALEYADYDTGDTITFEITDPRAMAIHTYLLTLIATEDLEDYTPERKISDIRDWEGNGGYGSGYRFSPQQIKDIFDFDV